MNRAYLKKIVRRFAGETGFTLVELIVSLLVGAILAATITPFIQTSIESYESSTTVTEAYQSSRIAFNRLLSELRMIPRTSDVTAISSGSITFWDRSPVEVNYSLSEGQLLRNGYTFVEGVSAFTITPKDSTGASLTPAPFDDMVWSYQVDITVTRQIGNNAKELTLSGEVFPRNYHLD